MVPRVKARTRSRFRTAQCRSFWFLGVNGLSTRQRYAVVNQGGDGVKEGNWCRQKNVSRVSCYTPITKGGNPFEEGI